MFCTFITKEGRTLIIRTEDIRQLLDREDGGCTVTWLVGNDPHFTTVEGAAQENLDRLRAEELQAIEAAQRLQQRQTQGLPMLPIPRGKAKSSA